MSETFENIVEQKPVKKAGRPRTKAVNESGLPANAVEIPNPGSEPVPADKEGTGAFIKRVLTMNTFTSAEIIQFVKENYSNSKIAIGDISFWRHHLKTQGIELKTVFVNKKGVRYQKQGK
jgi:hypothetical protein